MRRGAGGARETGFEREGASCKSTAEPEGDSAGGRRSAQCSLSPLERDRRPVAGEPGGMGSGNSGSVMGVGIEGARENNPLKLAPGERSEGERAVEDSVHVGAVPTTLRSAISADDRIVTGDEDGASVARVRATARGIKRKVDGSGGAAGLGKLAAGRPRKGDEAPGEDGPVSAVVNRGPENGRGTTNLGAADVRRGAVVCDLKAAVAWQPVTGSSSDASTWTGVPAGITVVLTSRQRKRSQLWQ